MDQAQQYSCALTGFAGMEAEILRLRNTNRKNPETAEYLAWRYHTPVGAPPPNVHWLLDADGRRVGMAAAIFRPYWVDRVRTHVAVVGDISVDARLRGHGLGRMLLESLTSHLERQYPDHPALVIPTERARRTLAGLGWITAGELAPLVCVLDPTRYLKGLVRNAAVARSIARPLRAAVHALVRLQVPRGGTLDVDDSIAPLHQSAQWAAAASTITRDMSAESLRWRYSLHPHTRFRFAVYRRADAVRGFLVFEDRQADSICAVYDLVADSAADLRALLALFIARGLATPGLATLRVLLDARHPARAELRRVGFIVRPADAAFQVRGGPADTRNLRWRITQGDKDI